MKAILSVGLTSMHSLPDQIHHGLSAQRQQIPGVGTNPFSPQGKTRYALDKYMQISKCQGLRPTFLHS